jgi:Mor family transcriptional regulator
MAAIDYSLEKHVAYLAPEPPSGWCQSMAARLGKKILYLPLGTFSPVTLKKIRQFHVLDGHEVRRYANHYI